MKQTIRSLHNMQRLERTTADFLTQMIELEKLRETGRLAETEASNISGGLRTCPGNAQRRRAEYYR